MGAVSKLVTLVDGSSVYIDEITEILAVVPRWTIRGKRWRVRITWSADDTAPYSLWMEFRSEGDARSFAIDLAAQVNAANAERPAVALEPESPTP